MESQTPFRLLRSMAKKKPASPLSPIPKSPSAKAAAAAPSPSKEVAAPPPGEQILTPEKPINFPMRAKNRSRAFSIKDVRKIARGLHETRSDGDLLPEEEDPVGSDVVDSVPKPSRSKTPVKLPEKYEMLVEFFNSMDSSIRLLRMKGSSPTFPNICASIQNLTERRFTYGHLAQLKYILPEAIVIRKVVLHDEASSCMKPELHVSLLVDAIENDMKGKGENGYSNLRKIFRERLADFSKEHPEGKDIPMEQLPHPFNQTGQSILPNVAGTFSNSPLCHQSPFCAPSPNQFTVPSHVPQSFQRRFSQKTPLSNAEKTPLSGYNGESPKDDPLLSVSPSPKKCIKLPINRKSLLGSSLPFSVSSSLKTHEEAKMSAEPETRSSKELNVLEGTPAKLVSTPVRLMTATPDIQTPKRLRVPMDYECTPPRKSRSARTLQFATPTKTAIHVDKQNDARSSSADDDVLNFLPETLLESLKEKERKVLEESDAGLAQRKRRQKLIACLPNTFNMILLVFQSGNRSIMTKQELIHKIIANHCKIVDRGEVEEQLQLLQDIVPDWISEKVSSSGGIICRVNKMSSPEEIRQRLLEAE